MKRFILPWSFFARPTLRVARELLGKYLVRRLDGGVYSGKIIEVEAYKGQEDLACHASRGRTKRTEVLYAKPGTIYAHLVYGMYWCFNVVTDRAEYPAAVLIRAVVPVEGVGLMEKNRDKSVSRRRAAASPPVSHLTNGPGKLCMAFGITGALHGKMLGRDTLTIEDRAEKISRGSISALPRVGVEYAKHCAKYPLRFQLARSL